MSKRRFKLPLRAIFMLGLVAILLTDVFTPHSIQAQLGPLLPPAPIPGTDGVLIGADYWSDKPMILSAGLGFEGIIGIDEYTVEDVREAGASWYSSLACTSGAEPTDGDRTAAVTKDIMAPLSTGKPDYADALPIVFSWPVATDTIDLTDFQYTLNNGEIGVLEGYTMFPNWEYNERNVVVLNGEFANRGSASDPDAIFPVRLDIVGDLILVGPSGQEVNARGLFWETDATPYDVGPSLVGAKINRVDPQPIGEGGPTALVALTGAFPNHELAVHGEGNFRIRTLTTGGFSPDGVLAVTPGDYEKFFRVHANGVNGETVLLEKVGVEYEVAGGTLRVVGLADMGRAENPQAGIYYDDCYSEDRDNYLDIILVGDEEAARNVTFIEIPATEEGYQPFYNPGGPGPDPFEGVRHTAPGPADLEPVINALDDPMRVTRFPSEPNFISLPLGDLLYAQNAAMVPESIEWDAANSQFLVSSVTFGSIFSVQDTGVTMPFIVSKNLTNSVGIHLDTATNRLLVAVGNIQANRNEDLPGFARLGIYDMETREELHFVDLGSLYPNGRHFANDVTVDANGNAYITDTLSPVIYKVDMDGNATVFAEDPTFSGLNGIVYHPDGYLLVGTNANGGLYKVMLDDPTNVSRVELSEPLVMDGLVLNNDLALVAVIQPPARNVVLLVSADDWATANVTATAPVLTPLFPTAATFRDGELYVSHADFAAVQSGKITLAYPILRTSFTGTK
jgi:sugar lactone lactonase YvrE